MYPGPIFTIFGHGIFAYGLCIGIGILICLVVFYAFTKKLGMPSKVQDFIFVVAIVGIATGFLFAKLYQAVYDWIDNGFTNFDFYGAGMTVMGGLIGGAACLLASYFGFGALYFRDKDKNLHIKHFGTLLNVAPLCILVAHGFGRIGCAFAGCCHGAFVSDTYVFGTIPRSTYNTYTGVSTFHGYYVPVQLFEALFLFGLFALLSYMLLKKRLNIILSCYLVGYGIWRIIIEIFRTDERGAVILGLQPSQWQSIIFIVLGVALIGIYLWRKIPLVLKPKEEDRQE